MAASEAGSRRVEGGHTPAASALAYRVQHRSERMAAASWRLHRNGWTILQRHSTEGDSSGTSVAPSGHGAPWLLSSSRAKMTLAFQTSFRTVFFVLKRDVIQQRNIRSEDWAGRLRSNPMPSRLIINADDFGLTHGVNRAIAELHEAKALTSTTLMATGAAFDDAVSIALAHPTLGVGCHVVLTDGAPASPPQSIPTLLGPDGRTFRPALLDFIQALLLGKNSRDDIEREARAQIQKLQNAGINVTHLDTHKHAHLFPA